MKRLWLMVLVAVPALAQPKALSLAEAEAMALKNHPAVAAAQLNAEAQAEVPKQVRSALAPQVSGGTSLVGATNRARIAAGGLNNPVIFSRVGIGLNYSQLLYDAGRTRLLADSATERAAAELQMRDATRAAVVLQVNQAYFAVLRAEAVQRVARQTVEARQTVFDQVQALADAKIKSGLDLSFADVSLGEAKLLAANAISDLEAARADLSAALGLREPETFTLTEPAPPEVLAGDPKPLITRALESRPEVLARRHEFESAQRMAQADTKLSRPTISSAGSVGGVPAHASGLEKDYYAAAGLIFNLNFLNGGQFRSRQTESALRARASEQRLREVENRVSRDVSVAYLQARNAYERLRLTDQLLNRATLALDLAQARYDLGLSAIVELSQAQLAKTSAEIQQASARYDYLAQRAALAFQTADILK